MMLYLVCVWMLFLSMIQPPPFIDNLGYTTWIYTITLGFSIILVITLTIIVGWLLTRMYPSPKLTRRDYTALTVFIAMVLFACALYYTPLAPHSVLLTYFAAVFAAWYSATRTCWWKKASNHDEKK